MRNKGMRLVRVEDIRDNLFVRKALDQDHVLYLAELIESGVEMRDPIEVTDQPEQNTIVDGRHRKHAYELNEVKEIKVRVLEFEDETEMISYAYQANAGGSKPPSKADTEHTIEVLLRRGMPKKRIAELLDLPHDLARKYVNLVHSKMERQKIMRAAEAVREGGLTVAKAAVTYDVDPDRLKAALSGGKRQPKSGIEEARRRLTKAYKSLGMRNAAIIRSLLEKYDEGDVTERQVADIISHIEHLQKLSSRALQDWKLRFERKLSISITNLSNLSKTT